MIIFTYHCIKFFKVLLCANNRPVLNDVTYAELVLIVQRAAKISPVIESSLKSGKLMCINSGMYMLIRIMLRNVLVISILFDVLRLNYTNTIYIKYKLLTKEDDQNRITCYEETIKMYYFSSD